MKQEEKYRLLKMALNKYGEDAQIDMMIEEMSELIKELLKYRRYKKEGWGISKILEEVADVQIMINQMKIMFGDTTSYEIVKFKRLESLLKE